MPKINNKTSIFLIYRTSNKLSETTKGLTFLARQAYANRKFESLRLISERLMPSDTGEYFQALAESKNGDGDMPSVRKTFDRLADSPSIQIRAAVRLFLGWDNIRLKNYSEARRLFMQASSLAASHGICAPLTFINAQNALSILLAQNGAYKESLELIKGNENLVHQVGKFLPAVLGEWSNNLACNYLDLNQINSASYYSNKAISMKVSVNFPEWFDTKKDIDERFNQRDFESLNVPPSYNRSEILGNLRHFPVSKNYFQVHYKSQRYRHKVLDYLVNSSNESESRFGALLEVFDWLCSKKETGHEIEGVLSPDSKQTVEYKNNLKESKLRDFFEVIENVKAFELVNPLPTQAEEEEASWLSPLLEISK